MPTNSSSASSTTSTQNEELRNVVVEVARTQLAAVTASLKFWGGWVESANKYTQKMNAELEKVGTGELASQKFAGQFTDISREYMREIIALPNVALEHFTSEIEKISKPAAKRTRKAKAKE